VDWIDERIEHITKKLKIVSLKNALQIYILLGIAAVVIFSLLTMFICNNWIRLIIFKYEGFTSYDIVGEYVYIDKIFSSMQNSDKVLTIIINLIKNFSPIIYSIVSIIVISKLYYKNKLEIPLNILKEEAKHIGEEDYSFECTYETGDEMGEICETFDNMRRQLITNKENLWRQINEERRLKAAFAHDLRTPLTVLKGYTELLIKYYPEGKIDEEKMMETLNMMKSQIVRLENFGGTMKKINTLEELELNKIEITKGDFISSIESLVKGINDTQDKKLRLHVDDIQSEFAVDKDIVIQVLENVLSNALRYCNNTIDITIKTEDSFLFIYVKDDGRGFTKEELNKACQPYYTSSKCENHYGLGLSICKLLCEKHNGNISLFNSIDGGAIVCATFQTP